MLAHLSDSSRLLVHQARWPKLCGYTNEGFASALERHGDFFSHAMIDTARELISLEF